MSDSLDERAKLEIQIATYLEIAHVAVDPDTLQYIKGQISELEERLAANRGLSRDIATTSKEDAATRKGIRTVILQAKRPAT